MKWKILIMGTLALAVSFSACQNKSQKSETESEGSSAQMSSDTSQRAAGTSQSSMDTTKGSGVMRAMDKMMKDMHQMEMTGNTDYDLISMNRIHHQGAIDMGKAELESGTDAKMKQIAQKIVDEQSKEKDQLDNMLTKADKSKKDYDPAKKDSGLGKEMNDNMMKMMEMTNDAQGNIDREFAAMMIKHHNDGIRMGNTIIKYSKMEDFKAMAKKMITDQTKDISDLKQAAGGK